MAGETLKLSAATLNSIDPAVRVPLYDRSAIKQHTVHIGVGGFHRAHQAMYLDELLGMPDTPRWGECGMGILLHDSRMRDALQSQDYLYTLVERSADAQTARVIGSITGFLLAPEDREAAIEKLAHEDTRLVTLTVTEGGYFIDDATGAFTANHPDIQHDAQYPAEPRTTLGFLAEALRRKRDRNLPPFTVMSCDNLQGNGHVIKRVLLEFVSLTDKDLAQWIESNVAFPNSMVDRITPGTTPNDVVALQKNFGITDAWPVVTEPFIQWVIEDEFCNGRPEWERVGVELVHDVAPYEIMKMRLLNGSHMAMAYTGALAGNELVHEVMQNPLFTEFIEAFMEEVTPVVPRIEGVDVTKYKRTLIERFSNPTINDQVTRICSEGSAKMPKWVIPSITDLLARGLPTDLLSLVVAAWIVYLRRQKDEKGVPLNIIDARRDELCAICVDGGADPKPMLGVANIFGTLGEDSGFVARVRRMMEQIDEAGVEATLRKTLDERR